MRRIYLDNNATTPLHPEVLSSMMPFLKEDFGNPSSHHQFGRKVKVRIDEEREKIAAAIGANPSEVVFTSGGSESDNFAIKGFAWANRRNNAGHIITSSIEHPAVIEACRYLEKIGFQITYLPVDEYGLVNPVDLEKAITNNTILISVHHSNNETGTIEPIEEISSIAKSKGVKLHTDAVQSLSKVPLDVNELGVDILSISAHKLYGPKGIGAIYIRSGINMQPLINGGGHEKKRRGGTENVAGIIGFGKACETAVSDIKKKTSDMAALRDRLQNLIMERIPDTKLNGHPVKRLPSTLNIGFESADGEAIAANLDLEGVAVSVGSACSSGSIEPSHVLMAMGLSKKIIQGSIRFSFGMENTIEDVNYIMDILPAIVERVREISFAA